MAQIAAQAEGERMSEDAALAVMTDRQHNIVEDFAGAARSAWPSTPLERMA